MPHSKKPPSTAIKTKNRERSFVKHEPAHILEKIPLLVFEPDFLL